MKKLLFALLLMPALAFAGWSNGGKVTDIYSHNGSVLIRTSITDGPCAVGQFWWPTDDTDSQNMLSLALVSFSMGKNITVVYDSEVPGCLYGFAKMTHLRITNTD
jgi:type 1 fimbria pilin